MSGSICTEFPKNEVDFLANGGRLKAKVYTIADGDKRYVVKDYSHIHPILKPFAALMVKNEVTALKRLEGSRHIPKLIDKQDRYRIFMEHIEGCHPGECASKMNQKVFEEADNFLRYMHNIGIMHNDLRRRNLIVHPERGVVFIDFTAALISSEKRNLLLKTFLNWFSKKLKTADTYHMVKIKSQLTEIPLNSCEKRYLERDRPFKKLSIFWKKYFRKK